METLKNNTVREVIFKTLQSNQTPQNPLIGSEVDYFNKGKLIGWNLKEEYPVALILLEDGKVEEVEPLNFKYLN